MARTRGWLVRVKRIAKGVFVFAGLAVAGLTTWYLRSPAVPAGHLDRPFAAVLQQDLARPGKRHHVATGHAAVGLDDQRYRIERIDAGRGPEEIADQYGHLNLAQVYAALACYHANRTEIDMQLAEEEAEYERLVSANKTGAGNV
mgnify:CR=1 FL=1